MNSAPKYPRIPHLLAGRRIDVQDRFLDDEQRERLLSGLILVEEKLDGANVSIWFDGRSMQFATRGGADTMDRGGILGRVRQWGYENSDALRAALKEQFVLYGEWLLVQHEIAYTRLPAPIVGLDVLGRAEGVFLDASERDVVLAEADVPSPPRLFTGHLDSVDATFRLVRRSAFGDQDAEGIIIRSLAPDDASMPRIAKLVRDDFSQMRNLPVTARENVVVAG